MRIAASPACTAPQAAQTGFVIPYGDCPLDSDKVGERVYMDLLNRAQRYVHIMTPYLILDHEMLDSLQHAGKKGLDVKIIMPIAVLSCIVFNLPVGYLLGFTLGMGAQGLILGFTVGLTTAAVLLIVRYRRDIRRWKAGIR